VKSKDVVHEYETEFGVFPVSDVIDMRKSKFLAKYVLSDNPLCQLCKTIVTKLHGSYCVGVHSLVKFSSHVLIHYRFIAGFYSE